jgi:hypothetical protein
MKTWVSATLAVAGLLVSSAAGAANVEPKAKSSAGPSSTSSSSGGLGSSEPPAGDVRGGDQSKGRKPSEDKSWEVGAFWETHRLLRQDDLGGDAPNKLFNFLYLYTNWDITENNRIGLRFGAYQRLIADEGETGIRSDDLVLAYTRRFPLPAEFAARAVLSATAPTSFASQKASLITAPRLTLGMSKRAGRLTLDLRALGTAYVTKYREMEGGNPNAKYSFGGVLEADFRIPYLEWLKLGAALNTGWTWYYDVANGADKPIATVADATYPNQPVQQSYGGEVFLRADLPDLGGVKSDLTVSLAQGDPTLGSTSVLHDGVGHVYAFWRHSSEVYFTLGVRY